MLSGTGMKKLFLLKILEGAGIRKTPFNLLDEADMKELFPINILGGADTKNLNSTKMQEGLVQKKPLYSVC